LKKRLIVGISGASGIIYGIRLLEVLREVDDLKTHLIISSAAKRTALLETDYTIDQIQNLAGKVYNFNDIAASISSGSYKTIGMVIITCADKTLSGIANSYKEQRRLVLVLRETPLHLGHVRLMAQVIEMGAILMPPMPAFYHRPKTIDDIINQTVNRVLDLFDIELPVDLFQRWQGPTNRQK
jgi:4-hydroxy-3-polyprenylbenzoate decarboxylase